MTMYQHNEDRLKAWYRRSIWGGVQPSDQERIRTVLSYMLRQLSHGVVPDADLVFDTLEGRVPVPSCGFIGCTWNEEHVH
jgi:hypothetical protein